MQTINSNSNSRKSSSRRKQSLSVCVALLSATTSTVDGFGAVRSTSAQGSHQQLRNDAVPIIRTTTELYYQAGNSNTQDEQATANNGVGTWFNSILKPLSEKDDFEKYVDFLGSRHSRLHFQDPSSTASVGKLGLKDVQNKFKAKQSITAFNFKEASTILDTKATADIPTAKKVSQVMFHAQMANMPVATSLPTLIATKVAVGSSALLKQHQALRMFVKLAVERMQMVLAKVVAFAFSPVSRDTARRVQTTASLAMACALLMYKPLKGVALAAGTISRSA